MKLSITLLAAGTLGWAALATPAGAAAEKDPKALFIQNKCNSCHAIKSQGVTVVEEEGAEAEPEDEDAPKPPDLSDIGSKHAAAWIKDWVLKKVDVEGKKHRKKFEGKPAELDAIATWLASLKAPAK